MESFFLGNASCDAEFHHFAGFFGLCTIGHILRESGAGREQDLFCPKMLFCRATLQFLEERIFRVSCAGICFGEPGHKDIQKSVRPCFACRRLADI